jgi:antitoxin CcdA
MRMNHAHEPWAWTLIGLNAAAEEGGLELKLELHRSSGAKRATNLSVRGDLIDAARAARFNLSALLERALEAELVRLRWRQWRDANAASIAAYNRHVKDYGTFSRICLRL